ncbi:uncharacterized protein CLUP02_12637 [Colletotrichum lupini]|uniref:Uncharacterized protein n=1 Tax=Colletotrichum lupini TaxID=145971 RepID=A0A9Q8T1A3_9PEZI|nr:uncharacterized protein CLUP02_12637 [Colletotrichum lupini]UQC87135.1 hypothetical protein CLUP02_12637 [Colletotrichum lupini]
MHLVHVMQSPTVSPGPVPCSASDSPTSGTPPCRVPAASGRVLLVYPHLPSGKSASRTRMAFGHLAEASFSHGEPAYLVRIYFCRRGCKRNRGHLSSLTEARHLAHRASSL